MLYPSGNLKHGAHRQGGAVLVVALLLLLIMTLLALGASQSTRLQERMAGNQRDMEMALQAAEATLRTGEAYAAALGDIVSVCTTPTAGCDVYDVAALPTNMSRNTNAWWTTWGRQYTESMGVASTPEYVVENIARVGSPGVGGSKLKANRVFRRVTARSTGLTSTGQAVLQSTYANIEFTTY